jgi:hypothetical protein
MLSATGSSYMAGELVEAMNVDAPAMCQSAQDLTLEIDAARSPAGGSISPSDWLTSDIWSARVVVSTVWPPWQLLPEGQPHVAWWAQQGSNL